eukprot:15484754-Alexandrium_andersonii.AAC.1
MATPRLLGAAKRATRNTANRSPVGPISGPPRRRISYRDMRGEHIVHSQLHVLSCAARAARKEDKRNA